jgi:ABC-2 type transport system ATP-binding protein
VAGLLAAASGDRALLRTTAPEAAAMVLEGAGACVTATEPGALTVTGLGTGQITALLGQQAVPFSELSAHRATLEEAYLGLTQDAVEYRAEAAGDVR